jgi:ComF family protein
MRLRNILSNFFYLFYPRICGGCNGSLLENENFICTHCNFHLPITNFQNEIDNEVEQTFWGRVNIKYATAYIVFKKESSVQELLHKLKYKGDKELGFYLGQQMGFSMENSRFNEVDVIVPVPLHKSRKRARGYNQSEILANGISDVLCKPVIVNVLKRTKANKTQTRKHRFERWQNVQNIFDIENAEMLHNKHVLLIDDVVTTGATIEACVQALLEIPGVTVSLAALAKA